MQVKRIKCPKCNVVLDVKNSKGLPELQISCPRCDTSLLVKFKHQEAPIEAPTFYASPRKGNYDIEGPEQGGRPSFYARPWQQTNNGETQLGDGQTFETQLSDPPPRQTNSAVLRYGGETYPLSEGRNVIGRRGTTSKAMVQIATSDHFMSRQHCVITVTTKDDGTLKAVLSNYKNKNETTINGHTIVSGDAIILQDGNTITMGQTTVTYSINNS